MVQPHPVRACDVLQATPAHPGRRRLSARAAAIATAGAIPFSWTQCCFSFCAYAWLAFSYLRTGSASDLSAHKAIEANTFIGFGPYAYPMNTFYRANDAGSATVVTVAETAAVWSYKFDTTSIALRAFAELLRVSAFPDCLLYRRQCDRNEVEPATAFAMLDAVADAVRSNVDARAAASRTSQSLRRHAHYSSTHPSSLLLKAQHEYHDRVHHYLAPTIFTTPLWRTCQAHYYSSEQIAAATASVAATAAQERAGDPHSINSNNNSSSETAAASTPTAAVPDLCSAAYAGMRPSFCDEVWTTFSRSCPAHDSECAAVGRVSTHIAGRLDAIRRAHADATVDMVVVESTRDLTLYRGGLVFLGKRDFDVVTLIRVRTCHVTSRVCATHIVDEYRYEAEIFITNAREWDVIVTVLRGTAQAYYWIRLVALYVGCYAATADTRAIRQERERRVNAGAEPSRVRRHRAALMLFFKVPSQVVIYGSLAPVLYHTAAHVIDAPIVYELIKLKFDSLNGLFHLTTWELVTISSTQMRNVWVLAAVAHALVRVSTTMRTWTPELGVWGLPQFSIALASALTIVSQFRFLILRSTRVQHILALGVRSPTHPVLETSIGSLYGGGGKAALGGIYSDIKALAAAATLLFALALGVSLVLQRVYPGAHLVFWRSHSPTPLTAGVLWPTSALAVSWRDDVFRFDRFEHALRSSQKRLALNSVVPLYTSMRAQAVGAAVPPPLLLASQSNGLLDERSDAMSATFVLMNLTMLTDPATFLAWRCSHTATRIVVMRSNSARIGAAHSNDTRREYFVPLQSALTLTKDDGFTWIRVVSATELRWHELLRCG